MMKDRSCEVCVQKPTCRTLADAWEVIIRRPVMLSEGVYHSELSLLIAKYCKGFKTIEPCKGFDWWETNEKRVTFGELEVHDEFRLLIGENYEHLHEKVNPNTEWSKGGDRHGLSEHGMPLSILFNEKVIKL